MPTEISPWIERLRPHRLAIAIAALLVALAVALAWVAWRWGVTEDRMAMLQRAHALAAQHYDDFDEFHASGQRHVNSPGAKACNR